MGDFILILKEGEPGRKSPVEIWHHWFRNKMSHKYFQEEVAGGETNWETAKAMEQTPRCQLRAKR